MAETMIKAVLFLISALNLFSVSATHAYKIYQIYQHKKEPEKIDARSKLPNYEDKEKAYKAAILNVA